MPMQTLQLKIRSWYFQHSVQLDENYNSSVISYIKKFYTYTSCVGTFRTCVSGEVRPKTRRILLSYHQSKLRKTVLKHEVVAVCLSELQRAGRIDHSSWAIKSSVIASPGALSTSSLGRVLSLEHWKAAKVHPILPKDILVDTSNHQSVVSG